MPTSRLEFDGLMTDLRYPYRRPAQKLAAVPIPELEPPVCSTGLPSKFASRGIHARIVRVIPEAPHRVIVPRHRCGSARHPVGEFGKSGLGDDDGAGIL